MHLTYGVVTATLNARETVLTSVRSVLAQSLLPIELVVIDGGSDDGTVQLVESAFAEARATGNTCELRLMRQSSTGIANAWNEAIATLRSDVVLLVNADDWLEAGAAERFLAVFADEADTGIVHGNARFRSPEGRDLGVVGPSFISRLGIRCRTMHCSTAVRRTVYERRGGFNPAYRTALDFDFIERCWRAGERFVHIDEVVSNFTLGGVSNTQMARCDVESLRIGLVHSRTKILPLAAFLVRRAFMRPLRLAGFHLWARDAETEAVR